MNSKLLTSPRKIDLRLKSHKYREILWQATLKAETFEAALASAGLYGEFSYHNQDGNLSGEDLEVAIFEKYKHLFYIEEPHAFVVNAVGVLHVATETYDSGGHSRLLERILEIQTVQGEQTAIFLSRSASPLFLNRCQKFNTKIFQASGSLHQRCLSLVKVANSFAHIFLHIHPFDIRLALVARHLRNCGKKVYFVNHADERFSFGSGAANAVCEISSYGWHLTESRRAHNSQHFLGIPISKLGAWCERLPAFPKMVLTIGQPYKYKPTENLNFPEFVTRLISQTGCSFTIVGSRGAEPWWQTARKKHPSHLIFVGTVAHEDLKDLIAEACCYVDSFPIIGGTAFAEMAYSGVPVFGISNVPTGYSIADKVRLESVELLEKALIAYLSHGKLHYIINDLVKKMDATASLDAVARRFNAVVEGQYQELLPSFIEGAKNVSIDFFQEQWLKKKTVVVPFPQTSIPKFSVRLQYVREALISGDLLANDYIRALVFLLRRRPKLH